MKNLDDDITKLESKLKKYQKLQNDNIAQFLKSDKTSDQKKDFEVKSKNYTLSMDKYKKQLLELTNRDKKETSHELTHTNSVDINNTNVLKSAEKNVLSQSQPLLISEDHVLTDNTSLPKFSSLNRDENPKKAFKLFCENHNFFNFMHHKKNVDKRPPPILTNITDSKLDSNELLLNVHDNPATSLSEQINNSNSIKLSDLSSISASSSNGTSKKSTTEGNSSQTGQSKFYIMDEQLPPNANDQTNKEIKPSSNPSSIITQEAIECKLPKQSVESEIIEIANEPTLFPSNINNGSNNSVNNSNNYYNIISTNSPCTIVQLQKDICHITQNFRAEMDRLTQQQNQDRRNLESLRIKNQQDFATFNETISEIKQKCQQLAEQIHDTIELKLSETESLRHEIKSLEEKISYQIDDRTQDILEMIENIHTRISKIEIAHQRQQVMTLDSFENVSAARNLMLKFINILITFLQIVLMLLSTIASILTPFIRTRSRILMSFCFGLVIAILIKMNPHLFNKILASIFSYLKIATI